MLKKVWVVAAAAVLAGCPPTIDVGDDGGGEIVAGPEGGIFIRNGAAIDIPKGALATTVRITVTTTDTGIPEVPGRKRISLGYRFFPQGLTFQSPVKITIPWLADRVPKAVDPGTFDMRRQTPTDAYGALPGSSIFELDQIKAVQAPTERLGLFWDTSPTEPNIARLEISPKDDQYLSVGETKQYSARVVDPTGASIEGADVTWSVAPARVARIDGKSGLLTAQDPGKATVTARSGMRTATATLYVRGSSVGPNSFVHENPFPTGNDLWGGALAPGGFGTVFVGGNSTLLARDAQGVFTRLFSQPGAILKAVGGTSLDNAVAVGVAGTTGVLIEFKGAGKVPVVKQAPTVNPSMLWYDGNWGMAVGEGNDVFVRRNGQWDVVDSPTFERRLSVVGDGQGGFVTLGAQGSIYRWDPSTNSWKSQYQTQLSVLLTAGLLMNPAGTEAWAVGGGKLWHFENNGWSASNLPPAPVLTEATTLGATDGRLVIGGRVNKAGVVLLFQLDAGTPPALDAGTDAGVDAGFDAGVDPDAGFDPDAGTGDAGTLDAGAADAGSTDAGFQDAGIPMFDAGTPLPFGWRQVVLRAPQIPRGVFGDGLNGSNTYVVGDYGAVWKYGAGTLSEISSGFYGTVSDLAASDGGVYASVNECANPTCSTKIGTVYSRSADGRWAQLGNAPWGNELFAIAAKNGEVIVTTSNSAYHWDGAAWSTVQINGNVPPIRDLKFCGNFLYGVGTGGVFYKGSVNTLTTQGSISARTLHALHCPSDTEFWVAGQSTLLSRSSSMGAFTARNSMAITHADYRAVWSPGPAEGFAFGDARYGVYFDTATLNLIDAPGGLSPDVVRGLWGSKVDNLYMVGSSVVPTPFGFALRFDGNQWRLIDSGSQRGVTAIDGYGSSQIWLGTEGGGLLRAVVP